MTIGNSNTNSSKNRFTNLSVAKTIQIMRFSSTYVRWLAITATNHYSTALNSMYRTVFSASLPVFFPSFTFALSLLYTNSFECVGVQRAFPDDTEVFEGNQEFIQDGITFSAGSRYQVCFVQDFCVVLYRYEGSRYSVSLIVLFVTLTTPLLQFNIVCGLQSTSTMYTTVYCTLYIVNYTLHTAHIYILVLRNVYFLRMCTFSEHTQNTKYINSTHYDHSTQSLVQPVNIYYDTQLKLLLKQFLETQNLSH